MSLNPPLPPPSVLAAFGVSEPAPAPDGGRINATYVVRRQGGLAGLQRQSPVIAASVNEDIDAVTAHLEAKGLCTPRPLRTLEGALYHREGEEVWRLLSYLPGRTVHRVAGPAQAHSAGALIGRFHAALADFRRPFSFAR